MKLKLLTAALISILFTFSLVGSAHLSKKNWNFYTSKDIGPNNQLHIYDNLIFDENNLFFNSQNQKTYSINQKSGEINWIFQAQGYSPFPPLVENEQMFLANFDGNIYSLDKKTGYKLWQFNIDQGYSPDTPVVSSSQNEMLFFASRGGSLYALDKKTGEKIWTKEFKSLDQSKVFVPNTIHFGSIYTDKNNVYALNAIEKSFSALDQLTGELLWKIDNVSFDFNSPLFYDQTIILKQENYLLSIDKKTGRSIKFNKQGAKDSTWQVFKVKNDEKYVLILDAGTLFKTDISLQRNEWAFQGCHLVVNEKNKISESIVEIIKDKILIQKHLLLENSNPLIALNYISGQIEWSSPLDGLITSQLISGENFILGEENGDLVSISINNGTTNWQNKSNGQITQLLPINNQILSINSKYGKKVTLNYFSQDGKEVWQYTPDFLTDDKEIYVNRNNVYFINTDKNLIDKNIIEKIIISNSDPNKSKIKNINFFYKENKENHNPYLEVKEKTTVVWKIKEKWLKIQYLIKNFTNIFDFKFDQKIENNLLEITIHHDEQLYTNKFTDVRIDATFTKEDGSKLKTKGFYYDNNTWKIRFLAQETGTYKYNIVIQSPYFVKKSSANIQVHNVNKQAIKIQDGQFTINNEVVFFPIGIQNIFVDHNYNGIVTDEMSNSASSQPTTSKEQYAYLNLEKYLDTFQKEAGLNIFRYGVENVSPTLWQSFDAKEFALDVNGGKFGDQLVQELKKRDFKIIMTIFGFYPPFRTKEEMSNKENRRLLATYLDYIIARFSPYVDLFELSNEAEANEEWYKFVIDYLKENDPYQRPISTNWETNKITNLDFQSIHWYNQDDVYAGLLSRDINYLSKKYQNESQPVLISEFGFKNYSWFENSSESLRILTWLSIFQNMGIIFWNQGQNGIYENPDNANIYLGPKERSYLLSLNNFLPKDMTIPIKTKQFFVEKAGTQIYLLSNQDFILGYLLKINPESNESLTLNLDLTAKALVQWIDPKTNNIVAEQTIEQNQTNLKAPDFKVDLALKIKYLK